MSLFVVGHDCGHTTFSNYTWINDLCGHVAHAPLQSKSFRGFIIESNHLAPYWPWQKSHRKHHQHTSHIEKDVSHPWITEEQYSKWNFIQKHFRKLPVSGLFLWQVYTHLGTYYLRALSLYRFRNSGWQSFLAMVFLIHKQHREDSM